MTALPIVLGAVPMAELLAEVGRRYDLQCQVAERMSQRLKFAECRVAEALPPIEELSKLLTPEELNKLIAPRADGAS